MGSTLTSLSPQRHPIHRYQNIIITPQLYSGNFRSYNLVQSKFLAIRWPRAWVSAHESLCHVGVEHTHAHAHARKEPAKCLVCNVQQFAVRISSLNACFLCFTVHILAEALFDCRRIRQCRVSFKQRHLVWKRSTY